MLLFLFLATFIIFRDSKRSEYEGTSLYVTCRSFSYNENAFIVIRQLSVHASGSRENIKRVTTRQINKAGGE
jgi:hypothetical protein